MNHALPSLVLLQLAAIAAAQQQAPGAPIPERPWQQALAAGKQHHAPILAFVLPAADAAADEARVKALVELERSVQMLASKAGGPPVVRTERDLFLRQLQLLRRTDRRGFREMGEPTPAQAIFALAVPVVCTAADCGARPGENVVLCAPDGKRTHGFTLDLLDRDVFVQRVGDVVLAPAAVRARAATVAPGVTRDLARRAELVAKAADAKAAAEIVQIGQRLLQNLPGVAPALVSFAADEPQLAPELTWLEQQRAPLGTAAHTEHADPCPACGMGYMPPELNTVLRLIGP